MQTHIGMGSSSCICPDQWKDARNPNYAYQLYYLYANIATLNKLRRAKGLNLFSLRPHCGESGDPRHLGAAYLLAESINHGIELRNSIALRYLYYLDQVGLSVSPLSNEFLFLKLAENPFPKLFRTGLNVTLSTDDPLLFHLTSQPLIEEYVTSRASYGLSMIDMAEISRNSILMSGFSHERKTEMLGEGYDQLGPQRNNADYTNVPRIRETFRWQQLEAEWTYFDAMTTGSADELFVKSARTHASMTAAEGSY